jgi:Undecaprenyl-phosphate galactose phosphotransferase WbaP
MSQIELGEDASPAPSIEADPTETQTGVAVSDSGVHKTPQLLGPAFQSVAPAHSAFIEPLGNTNGTTASRAHARRVGARYLVQLCLTTIPLILVDLALLTIAILVARAFVRYIGIGTGIDVSASFLPIAVGFVLIAVELGLYPGIRLGPVEEFRRLAVSATLIFGMWTAGVILLTGGLQNQILFLSLAYVLSLVNLWVFRGFARRLLAMCPWWGFPTVVCGDDSVAVKVYRYLNSNKRLGLRPIGVISDAKASDVDVDAAWYAGTWSDARSIAEERRVFWAIVVPPEGPSTAITNIITEHLSTIPHIHILSELTGLPDHWSRHQQLDGLAGIHLQQNLMLPLPRITKRLMDIVLTIVGGIVLLPLLFYIAVAVKMSSRGPVLYANERIGRDGRRFRMWKFRSMFTNGDALLEYYLDAHPEFREEWETTQKLRWDPRITRIGRFIRKTSLDELPQLWNVLRGDMSLVGPRPILLEEETKYGDYYALYTMVSPGITGMWQVSGRSNTSYEERLQLVAYYVRNWSLWLDIYLLLKTVRIVFFGRGAF